MKAAGGSIDLFSQSFQYSTDLVISKKDTELMDLLMFIFDEGNLGISKRGSEYEQVLVNSDLGNFIAETVMIDDKRYLDFIIGTYGSDWIRSAQDMTESRIPGYECYKKGLGLE